MIAVTQGNPLRDGPGGHDDGIGMFFPHHIRRDGGVQFDFHLQIPQHVVVPSGENPVILFEVGHAARQQIAAQTVPFLVKDGIMAAELQHPGRFTACDATPDDHHFFRLKRRSQPGFALPTGGGIDRTAQGGIFLDAAHASFMAGEARTDQLPLSGPQFVHVFRVRQKGASQTDDVTGAAH